MPTISPSRKVIFAGTVEVGDLDFDVVTQTELDDHVAAVDPHTGYRLESVAIAAADVAADVATQAELDAAVGLPRALTGAVAATRYVGGVATVAPTSGTFAVGDFVVAQNGHVIVCVVAGSPGTWTNATAPRSQLALTAQGMIAETFQPHPGLANRSATDGTIFFVLLGLRAGDVIANVHLVVGAAGTGAGSTLAKVGLYNTSGTRLAVSADLGNAWESTGMKTHALSAAYTVTADGGYYVAAIAKNSTTVPSFRGGSSGAINDLAAVGSGSIAAGTQAGQTDLPASATIGAANAVAMWFGVS